MITFEPFWETLKDKGISTYTLINKYNMSSSLIHRIRHNMPISTVTLDDLCDILDCDVGDIIEHKSKDLITQAGHHSTL